MSPDCDVPADAELRRAVERIKAQLGTEPDPATRAAAAAILRQALPTVRREGRAA